MILISPFTSIKALFQAQAGGLRENPSDRENRTLRGSSELFLKPHGRTRIGMFEPRLNTPIDAPNLHQAPSAQRRLGDPTEQVAPLGACSNLTFDIYGFNFVVQRRQKGTPDKEGHSLVTSYLVRIAI